MPFGEEKLPNEEKREGSGKERGMQRINLLAEMVRDGKADLLSELKNPDFLEEMEREYSQKQK